MSLNNGAGEALHPGWPLVVRADALWLEEGGKAVTLDPATAGLSVKSAQGAAIDLAWRRVGVNAPGLVLDESTDLVRLVWVLPAAEAAALSVGDYTVVVEWAGQSSRPLQFEVAVEPSSPTPGDLDRQAILESKAALLLGDKDTAMAALAPAEARSPNSLGILEQKARVLIARGEFVPAMLTTQRALQIFRQQYPDAPEPPVGILFIQREAEAGWVQSQGAASAQGPPPPAPAQAAPVTREPAAQGFAVDPGAVPVARDPVGTAPVEPSAAVVAEQPVAAHEPTQQPLEPPVSTLPTDRSGAGPVSWLGEAPVPFEGTGQWALSARAGSEYGPVQNSAARATGAPDVPGTDDHPNAWCPAVRDSGSDWLELTFAKPGPATEVRVRQSFGPGAIVKVEALDLDGQAHLWWDGVDPYGQEGFAADAVWFSLQVPRTDYAVQAIRLTLNLAAHGRWKQIDAVQLIDAAP